MTDTSTSETRFEAADIPTLRRTLLRNADIHENRAGAYAHADTGAELAAWSGLLLAGSGNRIAAALLGIAQRDPGLTDAGRTEMTRLVGQVLDGWPEVLEGANDDVPVGPQPQIEGQGVLPVETAAPRGYRVGDLVQITGRGDLYDGKTGVVTEIDDDPEFSIGLTVEGFLDLVWCNSGEIRHADTADCPSCRGTGSHREPDPGDAEFESDRECLDCDGTGRVAAGAASAAETAGSAK